MPELFSSFATLSNAGQEALEGNFHKKKFLEISANVINANTRKVQKRYKKN